MQLTLYFAVSVLMLVDSYQPLSVNHIKYIKKNPNHSAPYVARYRWKDKLIPKLVGHSDPRHYYLGSKLKIHGLKEKLKNYVVFPSTNNSRRIDYRFFNEWSLHNVNESNNGTQDFDAKTSNLNIRNDKPNENENLNVTSEVNSTEITRIKIVDDALNDNTASKSDVSPLLEPITVNDSKQLSKSHVDNLFKALYKNKSTKTKVKHNETNGLYLNELDVDFEKDVAPIAENFTSDNNVIQDKSTDMKQGTDTSTTKPKARKERQTLKGLQDEIFTGGEETNLKRSVPGEAATYIIKKLKSPISLNHTFPMKDKNPIVPVTPVMESEKSEKESLELYNERIRNYATTAARDFLSKFIRKNLLRVRVKPILNTNRKKLGVEFVNDGLVFDIDEPVQTTETTTNILANILQHEDDAPLYNFMYNNNNTILNLLHNTNFLKETGHKNVSKEPAPTDLNQKVWRNIRDVLKVLLPENKMVKALYTVDGEKTEGRKTARLVQRSEPCKKQDISCIFDRINKLVNRIKRRAQISDEDMPHNFLQLQPYGIAADYDDGKAFEELFEQPDFNIQNLEDPVKDLPPSSPLYIPYYIGKYDKPHQHLRKSTYMRLQGDEVHPYHSHMPEIIWSKYDPLTNYYYTDFTPLNPKELEPPRIIETSDIDSVNIRRKSNFISNGNLSPKYDGMFDLYSKPIIKKISTSFIPEKIPENYIPENLKLDQQRYKSAIFDPMEPNMEYFDDLPEILLKKRSVDAHDYDDMQSNSLKLQLFDGIDNVQKLKDALHPTTKNFRDPNGSKRDNEVPYLSLKTDTSTPLLHHIESVESETIGTYDNDSNIHNFISNRNVNFKDIPGNNLNAIANTNATKQPTNEVTTNQNVSMTTVKIIIKSSKCETGQSNEEYFSGDEEWYEDSDNKKYIEDYSSKISNLIPLTFVSRIPNETYNTNNFNWQKVHKKLELNWKVKNGQKSNIEQIEDPIEETSTPNKAINAVSKENFQTELKLANREQNNTNSTDSNRTPTNENSYYKIDKVFTYLGQSPSILPLTYGQSYPYVKKIIERYIINPKGNENPGKITANNTAKGQVSKTSHKDTETKIGIHDNISDTEVMEIKQDSKINIGPITKIAVIDKIEFQFQTDLNGTESETTMMEREPEELKVIALKMHNIEKNFKQIEVINPKIEMKTEKNLEIVKNKPETKVTKIEPKYKMNKTETTTTSKKIEFQAEFNEIAPNNTKTTIKTLELKTDINVISPKNTQTTNKPIKTTMKMIEIKTEVKEIATKNEAIKFESDTEWTEMKVESEILKIKPKVQMVRNKSSIITKDKSRPPKTKRKDFESDTDWMEVEINHEIMNIKPMTKISTKLTKHNIGKREIQSQTPERYISLANRLEQAQITEKSAELKIPFMTETDPLAELEAIITGSENKKSQNQHQQIYSWRIITPPAPEAENKTTHIKAPLQKTKRAPFKSPIITEIKDNKILETDSPYDSEDVSSTPPEREKKIRFSLRVLTFPTSETETTYASSVTANTEETASETESEDLESTEMTKIENTTPKTKHIRMELSEKSNVKKTVIVTKDKKIESSETFNNTTTAGGTKGKQLKLSKENKTEMTVTETKNKHLKSSNKLTKKTAPIMKKKHNKSSKKTKTKKTRKSRKRKHRKERRRYIDIISNEVSFEAEQVRTLSENVNKGIKELPHKYDDIHRNYVKQNALSVENSKFREFEELSEFSISKGPLRRQKPNIVDESKHIGKKISLLGLWDSHKGRLPKHNKIAGGVSPLEIWKSFPVPSQKVARSLGKRQIEINGKRPRLLCAVLKQENEKEDHIINTWGKRCDILAFITVKKLFGGPKKVEHTWEVALRALTLIYKKHNLDADWFLKTDIHSYIMVDNLHHMLQGYRYEPLYFGPEFLKDCSTFVLSQEALKKLVDRSKDRKCHSNIVYYEFGMCLTALDIKIMTSQDEQGRSLFNSYGPFDFKKRQKATKSMHFRYWSDFAVAFQNVDVEDMYTMEYLIHRVKTTQRPPTPVTMRPLFKKPWIKNNEISNDVYEISNDNDDYLTVF